MNQRGGNQIGLASARYLRPEPSMKMMNMVRETGTVTAMARDRRARLALVLLVCSFLEAMAMELLGRGNEERKEEIYFMGEKVEGRKNERYGANLGVS